MKARFYQQRIEKVLNHIETHYHQDQSMQRLADIACLSPYHWHRIFMSYTGETIYQCIKRTRLKAAAKKIQEGQSIERIAQAVGYQHADSLIRAFKHSYGLTPHQFQQSQQPLIFKTGENTPSTLTLEKQHISLQNLPALSLASIEAEADYSQIPIQLNRIFSYLFSQGLMTTEARFFCFYYHDPHILYRHSLLWRPGVLTQNPIQNYQDIEAYVREPGPYLCTIHQGPYETLDTAWQQLYNSVTTREDLLIAHKPYFEEYLNNPRDTLAKNLRTFLALPVVTQP